MNIEVPDGITQEQFNAAIAQILANGNSDAGNALDLNQIPHNYDEAVRLLAAWHGSDSAEPITIYLLRDPSKETIQFIEVSKEFGADDVPRPVSMGSSGDFPFRSSVILISDTDWLLVQTAVKTLPQGWNLDNLEQVWPHE